MSGWQTLPSTPFSHRPKIARLGLVFRPGYKDTRECPLGRFPFLLIYRIEARAVRMLRVIDSRGAYLNERAKRGL